MHIAWQAEPPAAASWNAERRDLHALVPAVAHADERVGNTNSHYRSTRSTCSPKGRDDDAFSSLLLRGGRPVATARQRPPRIVLRKFHPAGGENSGASLGGSVMRNGISVLPAEATVGAAGDPPSRVTSAELRGPNSATADKKVGTLKPLSSQERLLHTYRKLITQNKL